MRLRLILLLLLGSVGIGSPCAFDILPVDEIVVGSSGVCLTELDGGERVEIPLTVLGTLGPAAPEGEMVLVRLEGERARRIGVVAGMSGSPVYVGGRLLGALSAGWAFAKDPIGAVTPFEKMLELADPGVSPTPGGLTVGDRPGLGEIQEAVIDGRIGELVVDWLLPNLGQSSVRWPLAVSASSQHPPCAWLAEGWRRLGWVSAPAGGGGGGADDRPLEPGSMVAGLLVKGDASVAAAGTVTAVRGDEVWAFGHPFLGGGSSRLPMARARVVTVMPSQASSFKIFSVGEVVGALEVDRTHGVWGRVGSSAAMVPIEVEATGRTYRFESVRHPVLTPLMVAYLVHASHSARGRVFGEQTVEMHLEAAYTEGVEVVVEETFSAPDAPARAAALISAVLAYLEGSVHAAPTIERVTVRIDAREQVERAEIIDAVPDRWRVRRGERVGVRVRLRAHRGDEIVRRVEVQIPNDVPGDRIDIVVADGASWTAYDLQMRPTLPASFADDVDLLGRLVPSTRLVVALEQRDLGVMVRGGSIAAPPSVVLALRSGLGPNMATTSHRVVALHQETMPHPVLGAQRLTLRVRTDGSEGAE